MSIKELNKIAILLFHAQQSTNQPSQNNKNHKNEHKDAMVGEEEEVMPVKVFKEKFDGVFCVVCFLIKMKI